VKQEHNQMKKLLLLSLLALGMMAYAQTTQEAESTVPTLKNWSIDLGVGAHKPVRPFSDGAYTNTPSLFQVDLGVRYMFNNKFGVNADFGYSSFEGDKNSTDFSTDYYRFTLEGVMNVGNMLGFREVSQRFGLLLHGGFGVSALEIEEASGGLHEMANFQVGLTPQFRLTNNLVVFGDLSFITHARQEYTFDGVRRADTDRGFDGSTVNASIGITMYLGDGAVPADFSQDPLVTKLYDVADKMEQMASENADEDQDGVPNYLDRDNTTESGVRVDSKGRAIDQNKNGIPDDMESSLNERYASKSDLQTSMNEVKDANKGLIGQLINEGYVNVYFNFNSTQPTTYSLGAINTIVMYMKDNPNASATVTGFADEVGSPEYNKTLSERRAKMVSDVLIAAGIDTNRLTQNGGGEDASVDKSSADARQLVRRVTFRVN
jgi:OOP family OmpA-OmpF porin